MGVLAERTQAELSRPGLMERIYKTVSMGGSLTSFCNACGLAYYEVAWWVNSNPERKARLEEAREVHKEWLRDKVSGALAEKATFDMGLVIDADGSPLPLRDWPEHLRRMVQTVDTTYDREGNPQTRVRFPDRLKAIEMLGRMHGLFTDNVKVDGSIDIGDIVTEGANRARARREKHGVGESGDPGQDSE